MRYRYACALGLLLVQQCALCMLVSSAAAAQDTVWAPRPPQRAAPWFDAVRAALESAEVVVHTTASADACASVEAGLQLASTLGVRRVLCLEVRDAGHGRGQPSIAARLVRSSTEVGEGTARVEHGAYAAAAREAYRLADIALDLGDTGLLRVQTSPEGALVVLDGEPIGHAPLEQRVAPGKHALKVTLEGFRGERRDVEILRGGIREISARLARGELDTGSDQARATRPSPLNWVLGGALVLGSAPLLVLSSSSLARDGDCSKHAGDGTCIERAQFGARSAVLLGLGLGMLVAGATVMLVQPFTIEVEAAPGHAWVGVRAQL